MTSTADRTDIGASVEFAVVDVFADVALTGNPLAVVPCADQLPVERMRAIAREFNQSETTFLLRPSDAGADHQLRSFTAAGHEVGGAGHNALGAWLWLAITGRVTPGSFRQQIGTDVLGVDVNRDSNGRFIVSMTQSTPRFEATVRDRPPLAAALGLDPSDLDERMPARVVSTGAAHLLVAVNDRDAVDRVVADAGRLRAVLEASGGEGCYVYTTTGNDSDAYARFFNPTMGIVEDPATGTAAGPLAAYLASLGLVDDGSTVVIDQGHAIGRPSRLRVGVDGEVVRLSGSGVIVAEGRMSV